MARSEAAGRILRVWVNVFVSAPVLALVPILMAVLGIGQTTVVVTVFLFAVFVIVLDTEVGVRQAEPLARRDGRVLRRHSRRPLPEDPAPRPRSRRSSPACASAPSAV